MQVSAQPKLNVTGSDQRSPEKLWLHLHRKATMRRQTSLLQTLFPRERRVRKHLTALYCSIPNIASILPDETNPQAPRLDVRQSVLHTFVRAGDAKLFGNAIMRKVVYFKWVTFAERRFLHELGIFIVYLVLHFVFSTLVVHVGEDSRAFSDLTSSSPGIASLVLGIIMPLFALRTLYREYVRARNADAASWLSSLIARITDGWSVLHIVSSIMVIQGSLMHIFRARAARVPISIASFLLWLLILYYLRAFEVGWGNRRFSFC